MNWKIISRVLVFLMGLLLLTGCSAQKEQNQVQEPADTGTTQETAQAEQAPEVILPSDAKIGIAYTYESGGFIDDFIPKTVGYLNAAGVAQENIDLREVTEEELESTAQEMISAGNSVLMIGNANPSAQESITKAASEAKMPVLYFGTDPGEDVRKGWEDKKIRVAYVGGNNEKAAQQRAELIDGMDWEKVDLNENEEIGVLVLDGEEGSDGSRINRETIEALEEYGYDVFILNGDEDEEEPEEGEEEPEEQTEEEEEEPEENEEEWDEQGDTRDYVVEMMREYGKELELILCANERQALGALEAVTDQKRLVGHDVIILGLDTGTEILTEIAKGNIMQTFFDDSMAQARSAADHVLTFLRCGDVPYVTLVDYVNVTVDNAQEILDVLSSSQNSDDSEEDTEEENEEENGF